MAIELGLDLPWEVLGVRFINAQDYIFSSLSILHFCCDVTSHDGVLNSKLPSFVLSGRG